jgi:hypothetical protein
MQRIKVSKQMQTSVEEKEENWVEFLEHYDLVDERMIE